MRNVPSAHTRVTELKVDQLTLLDNGTFTENICTFDERRVEKDLISYAKLPWGILVLLNEHTYNQTFMEQCSTFFPERSL